MTAHTLETLFGHHLWANLLLFECCADLTPEQLQATIPGAFGTIAVTLEHIVTSEQSYFSRISTGKRLERAERAPLTMTEMLDSLRTTGAGLIEWAPKVGPDDTVKIDWEDGSTRDVPKAILLTQIINHATEHREQIKAILTEIGIEPPDLQGWEYFDYLYKKAQGNG